MLKGRRRLGSQILLSCVTMLLLSSLVMLPSQISILPVYGSSNPADGDAWTENNNATYTWKFSPSYVDKMAFQTIDKYVGSYSLNINHTKRNSVYMAFYLDLKSGLNFTSYDFLCFRFKVVRSEGWTGSISLQVDSADAFNGDRQVNFGTLIPTSTWNKVVIPLDAFIGTTSWSSMRYISFQIDGVSRRDGTRIYIDGMYFGNWASISVINSLDQDMLPNWISFLNKWQKTQTYLGQIYTSTWSMVPVSGTEEGNAELESEALGEIIYPLCLAYDYSRNQYYLDLAEQYANWLIRFQWTANPSDNRYGAFWANYVGNDTFVGNADPIHQGFCLAGLSYYYHLTGDSVVKAVIDRSANYMMSKLWDNTNKWYETRDMTTGAIVDQFLWDPMEQGGAVTGLATYYRLVQTNTTLKTQVDSCLNQGLGGSPAHHYYVQQNEFQSSVDAWFGYYTAYESFNNVTYYNEALKLAKVLRMQYEIQGSTEPWRTIMFCNLTNGYDGIGYAMSLPLLFKMYEHTGDTVYLRLLQKTLFDVLPSIQTGNYSITRYRLSGDEWVNWQYTPTNAFVVSSLAQYYAEIAQSCDINHDGTVSAQDLQVIAKAFGSHEGEAGYNPEADVNKDGTIDNQDLTVVKTQYGKNL